jgi:hypothetical protein
MGDSTFQRSRNRILLRRREGTLLLRKALVRIGANKYYLFKTFEGIFHDPGREKE